MGRLRAADTLSMNLGDELLYQKWREEKLDGYPIAPENLMVSIGSLADPSVEEVRALKERIKKTGMALYTVRGGAEGTRNELVSFGQIFGLNRLDSNLFSDDGITEIRVSGGGENYEFIPYTNKRIQWHTDGYYNPPERGVRGLLLHCSRPAISGGESFLLDPDLVYIGLRDENPEYIRALSDPEAMMIPVHKRDGKTIRPEIRAPVFTTRPDGTPLMRYTARTRSIEWKKDILLSEALEKLRSLLDSSRIFRWRLGAGEGLICRNVLHGRETFEDDPDAPRVFYRLRYYDGIDL